MQVNFIRRFLPYIPEWGSPWLRRKIVEMIPHEGIQRVRKISDTLHERSVAIYQERHRALELGEEALSLKLGKGHDLMSILRTRSCPIG